MLKNSLINHTLLHGVLLLGALSPALAQPLSTATVEYREVDTTYAAEAIIEAVRQSTVSAQVAGRIVELNYDVGDFVQKGQVIVRIDETEARQIVAGSQAQVAKAQAAFDNARTALERDRELVKEKFISQAALDKAQADYRVAEAQLKAARAGAGQAATTKAYTVVVAPYSGVVAARHVELGEMASPGKPLMTGFDPADMVRLDLPETTREVYPGMFARAYFTVGRARKLVAPIAAILRRSEVAGVYVVNADGAVSLRQVRLGEPTGQGEIEILAGVSAGENVALDPVKAGMSAGGRPE